MWHRTSSAKLTQEHSKQRKSGLSSATKFQLEQCVSPFQMCMQHDMWLPCLQAGTEMLETGSVMLKQLDQGPFVAAQPSTAHESY